MGTEFCQPMPIDRLLSPTRDEIWAGFMPPDALPIIGNDYGDWLCLRVNQSSEIQEVIRWSHAGGDWMPYGDSLAEAFVFDAAIRLAHLRRPEFTDPEPPDSQLFGAVEWAVAQLAMQPEPKVVPAFWKGEQKNRWRDEPDRLFQLLVDADVCIVAASCELALCALSNTLKTRSMPKTAARLGCDWNTDFVRWMFDGALLPHSVRDVLSAEWDVPAEALTNQNWESAANHAKRVLQQRDDLIWAADIAGWQAERCGDWALAAQHYLRGAGASVFTDDSVRFRTQWYPESFAKFSVFRLQHLRQEHGSHVLGGEAPLAGYLESCLSEPPSLAALKDGVANYWREQAAYAGEQGKSWQRYQCLTKAGWDLGTDDVAAYHDLLESLHVAARDADARALAAIAKTHLQALV